MEALHRFNHRKEQRTVAVQSKYSHSTLLHAPKHVSTKLMPSPYAADSPPDFPPPSTPSPMHPFVHLDSTSTASLSHLVPQSHVSSHNARQLLPEQTSTGSDTSSLSPCQATCTPRQNSIASASPKRVSLEQHLQCGDIGREEAMQSFILQRFLPAAKTVAADHDCTIYSAGKHLVGTSPSTTACSSLANSTPRAAPVHPKKSTMSPSKLIASKSVALLHPVSSDDDGEDDIVNHGEVAKSCGFFCVGLKSAVSRAHDVMCYTTSASKRRVTLSSSHGTSSDEEDAQPRSMKVMMQDAGSQSNASMSASVSLSSSSPATIDVQDTSMSRVARLKNSPALCPSSNAFDSRNYLDSRPSLNLCIKCRSDGPVHQPPAQVFPQENASQGIVRRQSMQNSRRCIDWCPDASLNSHSDNSKQASRGVTSSHRPLCNAGDPDCSSRDPASQTSFKESLVQDNFSEGALENCRCSEDDELVFYDALSRFDMSSSTPATRCKSMSTKSQNASVSLHKCTSGGHNMVQTHLAYVSKEDILAIDAHDVGHAKVCFGHQSDMTGQEGSCPAPTTGLKKCGSVFQSVNDLHEQPLNDSYSVISNAYQMNIPDGSHKKSSSSSVLGWPLGISSFHSSTSRNIAEVTKNHADNRAAKMESQSAKMAYAEETGRNNRRHVMNPHLPCIHEAYSEEGWRHCDQCITNTSSSSDVASPPVPPSPKSSWLGKALALKASKPSHLAILQQEEKVVSAKKKLEFTSASDAKKGVRWEDLVKGSQMHPQQYSFSEEIRHGHPAN